MFAIAVRGTVPRYRFDQATTLNWKNFIYIWLLFILLIVAFILHDSYSDSPFLDLMDYSLTAEDYRNDQLTNVIDVDLFSNGSEWDYIFEKKLEKINNIISNSNSPIDSNEEILPEVREVRNSMDKINFSKKISKIISENKRYYTDTCFDNHENVWFSKKNYLENHHKTMSRIRQMLYSRLEDHLHAMQEHYALTNNTPVNYVYKNSDWDLGSKKSNLDDDSTIELVDVYNLSNFGKICYTYRVLVNWFWESLTDLIPE